MAIKINGNTVISDSQAVTSTSTISATGNITGGNILTGGIVSAAGNIYGNNIIAGNLEIGNITLTGNIDVALITGNLTAANILTVGVVSTTGGVSTPAPISSAGTVTGGNLATPGTASAAGTGTFGNVASPGTMSSAGTVTGGNLATPGTASAAGTVTGGNLATPGTASAAGTVTGGNLATPGTMSAAGNVTGGNLATPGTVSAVGNVFALNISLTGNINLQNITASGNISATGNVTAGNLIGQNLTATRVTFVGANKELDDDAEFTYNDVTNTITVGNTSVTGTQTAASTVGGVITGSSVSATGNVTGANLVVSTNIYDATAMTLITGAGNINLQPAGNVVVNSKNINGVAQPVQDQDAATKLYVDNAVSTAISYHEAVTVATTTTLATATGGTITYAQPNGAGNGIGATLTTTGSFNLIDTANVQSANTRILVKNEANATHNGVYVWSNATVITRAATENTAGLGNVDALGLNDYFFVSSGNVNAGSAWVVDAPTGIITFGTSNIQFAQFSSSQTYTANTAAGISLSGTVFSAKVDGTTTVFDGGGNISVKSGAALTTPNIGVATGTSLSVTGAVTSASTVGGVITGSSTSVTGTTTAASVVGGVMTGSSLSVTGNVSGGNLNITGNIVDTGPLSLITAASGNVNLAPNGTNVLVVTTTGANITGTLDATGAVTGSQFNGSGAGLTSIPNGALSNSSITVNGTAISLGGSGTVTATATNALTIGTGLGGTSYNGSTGVTITNTGVTSAVAGTGVSVSAGTGAVTFSIGQAVGTGNSPTFAGLTLPSITKNGSNAVGNIGQTDNRFNTVFAQATSALYADLAEKYVADAEYAPGTVVVFGGSAEVTVDAADSDRRVAGVVSTNPAYIMNDGLSATFVAAVALTGRVPCLVTGTVRKGDLMVAAGLGRARAETDPRVGTVIGKALEDHDGELGTIEVVVGRF